MKILSVLSACIATDSWSTAFFVYDQEVCGLREDLLPPPARAAAKTRTALTAQTSAAARAAFAAQAVATARAAAKVEPILGLSNHHSKGSPLMAWGWETGASQGRTRAVGVAVRRCDEGRE